MGLVVIVVGIPTLTLWQLGPSSAFSYCHDDDRCGLLLAAALATSSILSLSSLPLPYLTLPYLDRPRFPSPPGRCLLQGAESRQQKRDNAPPFHCCLAGKQAVCGAPARKGQTGRTSQVSERAIVGKWEHGPAWGLDNWRLSVHSFHSARTNGWHITTKAQAARASGAEGEERRAFLN